MSPELRQALLQLIDWVKETALPFWGTIGVDANRGGFHERLDLQGAPALSVPKRLMVQGRQLYVYSTAARLGWYPDGHRLAHRCTEYLLNAYFEADGSPGWVHALNPDGSVANGMRDAYGHAFVLFGLAAYHQLTNDSQVLSIVERTLAFLVEQLAAERGGYVDALPVSDKVRRQNPHMHLFEAFLALYEATRHKQYLAHASRVYKLFTDSFFQSDTGTLCEYLTVDLEPMPGAMGRIVEPGHHYEWIWLLHKYRNLCGHSVEPFTSRLYEFADRHGWDSDGFIVDELDVSGACVTKNRRAWPHTEALKANLVEGANGRVGAYERATQSVARLMETFIGKPIPQGWMDRVGYDGLPLAGFIPASTLYHVFCAATETAKYIEGKRT